MMSALEIDRGVVAPDFSSCNIVSLYCVEKSLYLTWDSIDIVSVNLRYCHISLATSMRQRHWALIADRQQWGDGHQKFPAPKLLRVTSSCVVKWFDEDGEFSSAPCIWEWEGITNIPPNIPTGNLTSITMPEMQRGNCSHCCPAGTTTPSSAAPPQPSTSSAATPQPSTSSADPQPPAVDSPDNSDDGDEEDVILEAQIITLKGSDMEKRYQVVLEEVNRQMLNLHRTVSVRLEHEPDNIADRNAIKIDAEVDGLWKIIGYVPVAKIPKVTSALRKREIVSVKLASAPRYQFFPSGKHGYGVSIVVVKKGKWLADNHHNVYNSDLSYI
ncbi:uncharacterized protein LOC144885839 [Branchiostoma floridae x Branchiostoma japonicum]